MATLFWQQLRLHTDLSRCIRNSPEEWAWIWLVSRWNFSIVVNQYANSRLGNILAAAVLFGNIVFWQDLRLQPCHSRSSRPCGCAPILSTIGTTLVALCMHYIGCLLYGYRLAHFMKISRATPGLPTGTPPTPHGHPTNTWRSHRVPVACASGAHGVCLGRLRGARGVPVRRPRGVRGVSVGSA